MTTLRDLSDDEIADELTTWAGRIAAGEAKLVALIGEFDHREAWGGPGMLSCAHWLTWRLGMGLKAAHERVRVARALIELPQVREAFGRGQLSWTQVRAITRVSSAEDEATWVELARHSTGAQLERLVRGVRRARKPEEDAVDPEAAAWREETRVFYDDDGTLAIIARLPAEEGAVVLAALEQARAVLDHERRTEHQAIGAASAEDSPPPASMAEGLMHLARTGLEAMATARPEAARRTRSRLVVQLDPLSGWGRLADGEVLPPSSLRGAAHCAPALRRTTAADRTRRDLGRT